MEGVEVGYLKRGDGMLFRRKATQEPKAVEPFVPWDEKTQKRVAALDQFNVQITSVARLDGFGRSSHYGATKLPVFEVSGFLTHPKFIYVQISFEAADTEDLGGWFYHVYTKGDVANNRDLPFLDVWLNSNHPVAEALVGSHKAALLSGRRSSSCRLWKRKGDGIFTEKDREHGYSYESAYPISGVYIWSEYQSARLPDWARPYGEEGFSLSELPDYVFGVRL
jgi:hypothetical protein